MSQEKGHQHVVSVQTEHVEACEGIATVLNIPKCTFGGGKRVLQWNIYKPSRKNWRKKRIRTRFRKYKCRNIHRHDCPHDLQQGHTPDDMYL